MDIHILRDGKQTGPFSEETVQVLLKQGSILINDLAWQPGMPEWLPLHAVLYPAAQPTGKSGIRSSHPIPSIPTVATPPQTASSAASIEPKPAAVEATTTTIATAGTEPATPRQKAFLTYIGTPFKADLTKEQAALLVNDSMENPKNAGKLKRWDEERLRLYPDLFADEIKAKRENRAQHFLEVCQTEGADFFDGVTKAHTQVLVGYLDVRFPNWDQDERSAKYDYLFPAISEKFPQLLTKLAKGRFKYPEGPRVAPELVRQPVAVRARPARSFFGAMVRGVIFGGMVLGLVIAAVKYGRGELQLPFDLPLDKLGMGPATASDITKKKHAATENTSPAVQPSNTVANTATPVPVAPTGTPNRSSTAPVPSPPTAVSVPTSPTGTPPTAPLANAEPSATTTAPMPAPSALPPTVSLFDAPPPATATPAPAASVPAAPPAPQVVTGRINKPTVVSLKFGTSTIRAGTPVQIMAIEGTSIKIKFGPDVVPVPASNVDLPESATPPAAPAQPAPAPQ
jgi:hypothetical protein